MKLLKLEEVESKVRIDGVVMKDFFGAKESDHVQMGYGIFPPGTKVKPSAHEENEYSYILSGSVKCQVGDIIHHAKAGMATFIPAGEEHASFNDSDEDCHLIWMLIKS